MLSHAKSLIKLNLLKTNDMKFKNICIALAATSTLSLGMISCSDSFLDEKMYSNYGPEVKDYKAKVLGIHRTFAALWGESGEQGFVSCWK